MLDEILPTRTTVDKLRTAEAMLYEILTTAPSVYQILPTEAIVRKS